MGDMEQVCGDYAPLLRESAGNSALDRKRTSKVKRKGSHIQTLIGDYKRTSDKGSSEDLLSCDSAQPSSREVRQMLGNLEDIKDYHKRIFLPRLEEAVADSKLISSLFQEEEGRLSKKYGRYCINNTRASLIIEEHLKFFSLYQHSQGIALRIDAMLIKPIQRLTRWEGEVLNYSVILYSTCIFNLKKKILFFNS